MSLIGPAATMSAVLSSGERAHNVSWVTSTEATSIYRGEQAKAVKPGGDSWPS